ncbi:ATP-grasp domain-containing protein, partial [Vibrio parahaemolyticus]
HHILAVTLAPAGIPPDVAAAATAIAAAIAARLDVTGLLAVEMFLTADGRVIVNELAPRTHNSGHWTIEGAVTSQFEQQ